MTTELSISVPDWVLDLIKDKQLLLAELERGVTDPDRSYTIVHKITGITAQLAGFLELRVSEAGEG